MIESTDPDPIRAKCKAITAFFPYAAWQERNGQHELLDTFLHTARASRKQGFMWDRVEPLITTLLGETNPSPTKRAVILVSPHLMWRNFTDDSRLIQLWAAAAVSAVPHTRDIDHTVVETLLLIGSLDSLRPHIPVGMWPWLNRRPPLPPICIGRSLGSKRDLVQMIRGLRDIDTLTSYLLIIWSEWDSDLFGFEEMRTLIREDFGGIKMGHHRKELLQHLNRILGQLDRGLDYLQRDKPTLRAHHIWRAKLQYGKLMEALIDREPLSFVFVVLFGPLTPVDRHRISPIVYVCNSPSVSIAVCPDHSTLFQTRQSSSVPLIFLAFLTELVFLFSLYHTLQF